MRRHGFTATELAIVIACMTVVLPICLHLGLQVQRQHELALWHLATADAMRDLSEDLRLDARRGGTALTDAVGWDDATCPVRYRRDATGDVVRETPATCGGTRTVARGVESFTAVPGGVEVVFARSERPDRTHRTTMFLPFSGTIREVAP